jgi:hypothetical protein
VQCDLQLRTTDQSYRDPSIHPSTHETQAGIPAIANESGLLGGKHETDRRASIDLGVPFLAGGVPDLGLDDLVVDVDAAGGELDADGGPGVEAELVAREAREQVGLADARVADEHHLEEVVVVVVRPVRHPP